MQIPKNETPREDQKNKKRKNSSNTSDGDGTTDSKGAFEKERKPNDPDGEQQTKRTKANDGDHDVKRSPSKT